MSLCRTTQESIALGEPLADTARAHLLDCAECSALAEEYSLLEASLAELEPEVPSGFAERVMARIPVERPNGLPLERRWLTLCFASAGGVIALANIAQFLSSTLLASIGLGGTP